MLNSEGFYGKLLEGWNAEKTENGIPYFINHESEKTQWDHPFYIKTLDELGDFDNIKYAAYRTAMKCRFLQKRFCFEQVDIRLLSTSFGRHIKESELMDCDTLESMLRDLAEAAYQPNALIQTSNHSPEVMVYLLLNWLLDLYDRERLGKLRVSSVKVALTLLSSARLTEKYKYIFKEIMNKNGHLDKTRMQQFLQDFVRVTDVLQETGSFGGTNVRPAVESCFARVWSSSLGVTENEFVSWLLKEPQTVVWLPTMHRLTAAESVSHESKCNICKAFPLTGLRYKCLKCFNYDMCQQCFLTGKVSKNHKVKHPTQEYCLSTSAKEDTKALLRTIRNNLSKKHRNKRKLRYLPIQSAQDFYPHSVESTAVGTVRSQSVDSVNTEEETETTQAATQRPEMLDGNERKELANIIMNLEQENRELMRELERVYSHPPSHRSRSDSDDSEPSDWIEKDKLDAKQEVLEAHNQQLELQLTRLRMLLHRETRDGSSAPHLTSELDESPQRLSALKSSTLNRIHDMLNQNNSDITSIAGAKRHRPRSCTPKLNSSIDRASYNHTPNLYNHAPDMYNQTPETFNQNPDSYNQTPDSLARYGLDLTVGSDDLTLGRTHFSLPSPPQLQHYPEEEAQLEEILEKINRAAPLDQPQQESANHQSAMGEMLQAANQIGEAFSGFVKNDGQSEVCKLKRQESVA